jgi:choline monooxygenase
MSRFNINKSIQLAATLPGEFYKSEKLFEECKEKIFARSWQWITSKDNLLGANSVFPFMFMPGLMDEPMVFSVNSDNIIKCLSNVCTHRGNILAESPTACKTINCKYHGRVFNMDGSFRSMPKFKEAQDFPTAADDLTVVPSATYNQFLFASIEPTYSFESITSVIDRKVGFLPFQQLKEDPKGHRIYLVNAHWALYCDNYLEGFHIPFVHPGLNQLLDAKNYYTEVFDFVNVQVGLAEDGIEAFDLPETHEDFGKSIAAYYFWIFPNLMLNFYPWGLSVNLVRPISLGRTKIEYYTYILDPDKVTNSAGAELDRVEREDEAIVELVQQGIRSRYYDMGRFSPSMEQGVHHFHSLVDRFMS